MTTVTPLVGRVVQYQLSEFDVEQINRRRRDFGAYRRMVATGLATGTLHHTGYVAHVGNDVRVAETYPAIIVRTWGAEPGSAVNLQVFLDGNDIFWATSRTEGVNPGQWVVLLH